MIKTTICFWAVPLKRWTIFRLCHFLSLPLLVIISVGVSGESVSWRETVFTSSHEPLLQHSFTTVPLQIQHDSNVTENTGDTRTNPTENCVLLPKILTASHLSSLRDLVSDKKTTVRLGLRVSLTGPHELLESQRLLSLKPGIYSIGGKAGLFSMRIVGIKKVTSTP